MRRTIVLVAALVTAAGIATAGDFTLDLDALDLQPRDPRTEARLAGWNSPLGRVAYQVAGEQARLGRGGLVGTPGGLVAGVRLQRRMGGLQLVTGTLEGGTTRSEQTVKVIRWPWHEADEPAPPPLDQQLAVMLGRRLERAR